jgi:hypothetical protein
VEDECCSLACPLDVTTMASLEDPTVENVSFDLLFDISNKDKKYTGEGMRVERGYEVEHRSY